MLENLVTLRAVAECDGEQLATLRVQAMRESLEQIGRFDARRARERFLSGFSPLETRHVLEGELKVGFVVVRNVGSELLLDHLYIHPEHQGKGIGSAVLEVVFAHADSVGKSIRVGALSQSRSNEFYTRHGFVVTEQGEWDNYYVRHPSSDA
jgi:GNAT superfamily N-acetyltransferase